MYVVAIDDDAAPAFRIIQRSADHAGLAAAERCHRVEQMGETAYPRVERGACRGVIGRRVAGADNHAGIGEHANARGCHLIGRQRDYSHAAMRRAQQGQFLVTRYMEIFRVVHTLACWRQIRSFQMDTEQAGHPFCERLLYRQKRSAHYGGIVAEQGRHEAGGAVAAMRGADPADRLDRRRLVEKHPAAAIDLHVDETGQQHRAAEVLLLHALQTRIAAGHQRGDVFAIQHDGKVVLPAVVGEHVGVGKGEGHG